MTPLRLALLSLLRHRFSTIISIISISTAVACSGMLLRLYQVSDARFSVLGEGGDAIVGAKAGGIEILLGSLNAEGKFPGFLPYKLFESLRAQQTIEHGDGIQTSPNYIESIIPFVYFAKYENYRVVGTDESFLQRPKPSNFISLKDGRWAQKQGEVVLGSQVAQERKLKVGDVLRAQAWLGPEEMRDDINFVVRGVLQETRSVWDLTLFSTVEQARATFSEHQKVIAPSSIWGPDVLHFFLVYLRPGGFEPLESLINKRTVGQAVEVDEQKKRLKEFSGLGQKIGLFVTAFIIFLGGLSVCSMLVTRFEGMSLQLAVLRALGYTKKELSTWLLWEGLLLGLCGVFFGALIDWAAFPVVRDLLGAALPPKELVANPILGSWMVWLVALSATIVSVFVPAWRMTRQDAHTFLKGL